MRSEFHTTIKEQKMLSKELMLNLGSTFNTEPICLKHKKKVSQFHTQISCINGNNHNKSIFVSKTNQNQDNPFMKIQNWTKPIIQKEQNHQKQGI